MGWSALKYLWNILTTQPGTTNTIDANKNGFGSLRGGKQSTRDADIKQYPTEFQRWYHRYYKGNQRGNATRDELKELFDDWLDMGKPTVK